MLPIVAVAALAVSQPPAGHADRNPLFRALTADGLPLGPGGKVKLPPPVLPDGLAAAAQRRAVEAFVAGDYGWGEFTRDSRVAPQILQIKDADGGAKDAPVRRLAVGFVVYGDLAATDDPKFLDKLLDVGRGSDGRGKEVTAADLAERDIPPAKGAGDRETFGHVEFDVLDRVRLAVTGRAVWSKTGESVLAAAAVDPRFPAADPEFPNRWRPLRKAASGVTVGDPRPYPGAGVYLKVTKLAGVKGALFAEQHVAFAEPVGWFDGANLLRSKLPPVVQSNVRDMRREWATAKPGR